MKNETLQISFDSEKLRALRFYMRQKDGSLETELATFVERLYTKFVPAPTREYIDMISADAAGGQEQ